jgi:SH3-like domain-containing protein
MSREYARRSNGGGNLPLIIAIVGTVIVIAVILYFLLSGSGNPFGPKATATPTLQPTNTPLADTPTPSPTPAPTPEATVQVIVVSESPSAVIQEATPTPAPAKVYKQATVWANSLNVREGAGMDYGKIGTVKRGDVFKVWDETSKWIKIQLSSGSYGWIWEDYTVRGDNPTLPAAPTSAPAESYVKSATIDAASTKITITFKGNAYGSSTATDYVNIPMSAFTVTEGGVSKLTSVSDCSGGTSIILTLSGATAGAEIKLTVDGDKIFDTAGEDTGDYSKTFNSGADVAGPTASFSRSGSIVTVTFNEDAYSTSGGSGNIGDGAFTVTAHMKGDSSTAVSVGHSVSHTAASKTATVTLDFSSLGAGETATVTVILKAGSVFDKSGNGCSQHTTTFDYTK